MSRFSGGRYSILPTGELYIRGVTQADGQKSYSCQTRHRLTGEIVASASAGSLFVTEPHGTSSPKIIDFRPMVSASEGETLELACAATAFPPPTYRWYKEEDGRLILLSANHRITQLEGSLVLQFVSVQDSGRYICSVNNTAGEDRSSTLLTVSAPLSVYVTPQRQIVDVGRSATFNCTVSGRPIRSLNWVKDQRPIEDFYGGGRVVLLSRDVLHIPIVQREDKGMYQCFAFNDFESAQSTAELKLGDGTTLPTNHRQKVENMGKLVIHEVQRTADEGFYTCEVIGPDNKRAEGKMHMRVLVAPVIENVMMPELLYAKEGTKTKVMCSVTQGDPPIQINWRKNGLALPMEKDLTMQNFEDSSVLVFRKISSIHSGNYTCFASNAASKVNRTTQIIVNVPPRWKIEPFNSFAVVGKTVIMKCLAEGYPTPRIYWKKAAGSQPKDFRDVLSSYRRQVFDNGTLVLQEVTESDGGHYLCQATNGIGTGLSKVIHLTIHTPPKFEAKFVSYTVPKGKDAELKCEAEGELPIRFEWEKDKQHLDPQSVKRLSAVKDSGPQSAVSKLIVKGASRSDSALYTCTASNEFGTDQTNIQLVVQGKF
ncbi:Down syndrome cell adhesion molecule-like protein 1 [Araneus ventricosus]|uniref:Down syndrome cell adhesion molecule-like protein 1 n=1 Tax=Araneus ventricosus TaxID=182803 RepID=A0A4Y2EJQ9_ARAVE|nr:Down syndrome cell adhesion molecule-like protein 1 [Araneus ventricosus]